MSEKPDDLPKAIHEGTTVLFGVTVRTYVLDDGRRIIDADDFHRLFAALGDNTSIGKDLK